MKMTVIIGTIIILTLLTAPAHSAPGALPDAVCGKGLHIGNPHCSSGSAISPAPNLAVGSAPLSSALLLIGTMYLMWYKNQHK